MITFATPKTGLTRRHHVAAAMTAAIVVGAGSWGGTASATPRTTTTTTATSTSTASTGQVTYYVDPAKGSDRNPGTSSTKPWRSLARVGQAVLHPGDTVRLKAGATHMGDLLLDEDATAALPITLAGYGTGALPLVTGGQCIVVSGDHVVVRDVRVDACAFAGVTLRGAGDRVEHVVASNNVAGVDVDYGSTGAVVTGSQLVGNTRMVIRPGTDDDYGAHGVLVNGDGATITGNTMTGQHASSPDYGVDGSAVEVFGAVGTRIDHNVADDNKSFVELGGYDGNRAADTVVAFNQVTGALVEQDFLTTRGAGQSWGPVLDTRAFNNSVLLTGEDSIGVGCYGGCGTDVLDLANNVVDVNGGWINADGPFLSTANVYDGWWGAAPHASDVKADPGFVAPAQGDLSLAPGSPAVDSGAAVADGWTDLAGHGVADGDGNGSCVPDRGAWERLGGAAC